MNSQLQLSAAGLALLKKYERGPVKSAPQGFAPVMYFCDAGRPTIGWGHVIKATEPALRTTTINAEVAEHLLTQDTALFEAAVRECVKVALTAWQFDALVCFAFNVGVGNLRASTLLKKLNAGDFAGAANEFLRWDKYKDPHTGTLCVAAGLARRRADERALFLGANYV